CGRNDFHSCNVEEYAHNHHGESDHYAPVSLRKPGKHASEICHEEGRIDSHVENGSYQRQPGLLKSPESAHGAAHPSVITTFEGQCAGEFADHERGGEPPEKRSEQQNEDRLAVPGAVNDVFGAIGSPRHHEEGGSH